MGEAAAGSLGTDVGQQHGDLEGTTQRGSPGQPPPPLRLLFPWNSVLGREFGKAKDPGPGDLGASFRNFDFLYSTLTIESI